MAQLPKTTGTMVATSILLALTSHAQAGGVHFDLGGMRIGRAPEQQEEAAPYVAPTSKPPIPLTASDDEILLHYLPVEDSGAYFAPVPTPPPLPTAPYGMVARQKPDLRSGCVLVQTERGGLPKCPKYEVWFERDWSVPQTEEERRNVEKADALIRGAGRVIAWAFGKLGDGVDYAATKEIEAERAEAATKTASGAVTTKPRSSEPPTAMQGGSAPGNGRLDQASNGAGAPAIPERPTQLKPAPSTPKKLASPVGPVANTKPPGRQRIPFVPEAFLESIEKIAKARVAHMWGLDAPPAPSAPNQKLVELMPPKPKAVAGRKTAEKKVAAGQPPKPVELHHGPDLSDGHYRGAPPLPNEPPRPSAAPRPEVETDASVEKKKSTVPAGGANTFWSAFSI